ncbi:MAG: alpha/beta hydrolase [Lachnospiraceae bacterium]|nr:alpha/beta hydrolase [Lachnospiraceae bacterium]
MTLKQEIITLNEERNVTLTAMIQSVEGEFSFKERPAVIVMPGGGYSFLSDREAEVVAYPYLAAGYHAFVLRYSVGEHRAWPNPLNDYEQAYAYIRARAEEWHVIMDKIAVIGFSAGGHLAASAATMAENRPNAAILIYAALDQHISSACQPGIEIPAPMDHVDGKTPACFLAASRDDMVVPISNTVHFLDELDKYGITYECHIYPFGNHGFSTGESYLNGELSSRTPHWVADSIAFLEDLFGKLTAEGMTTPACSPKQNANADETLSVKCTVGYLRQFTGKVPELIPYFEQVDELGDRLFGDAGASVADQLCFNVLFGMFGKSEEELQQMEERLRAIPNITDDAKR